MWSFAMLLLRYWSLVEDQLEAEMMQLAMKKRPRQVCSWKKDGYSKVDSDQGKIEIYEARPHRYCRAIG